MHLAALHIVKVHDFAAISQFTLEDYEWHDGDFGDGRANLIASRADQPGGLCFRAVSRIVDAYTEGVLDKQEFEPRLKQSRQRVERLRGEMERLAAQDIDREQLQRSLECLDEFAANIHQGLDQADRPTRRNIIRTLLNASKSSRSKSVLRTESASPFFSAKLAKREIYTFVGGVITLPRGVMAFWVLCRYIPSLPRTRPLSPP